MRFKSVGVIGLGHLSMDGVDDYILTPSISFTKIVLDVMITGIDRTRNNGIIDTRKDITNPYVFVNGTAGGKYLINVYVVKENGVVMTNDDVITLDERMTIEASLTGTGRINIFSDSSNARPIKGELYDIKVYNGDTLSAHYDMSKWNLLDQSGNGKDATLVGGTWVSDPSVDVSYEYTTRQDMYNEVQVQAQTEQRIYAPFEHEEKILQVIYKAEEWLISLTQRLYAQQELFSVLYQSIYADLELDFAMLISIFDKSHMYKQSINLDLEIKRKIEVLTEIKRTIDFEVKI